MMFITRKNIKQDVKSDEKYYSISFSANTIDFKLLNSLTPYYKVKKIIYKGNNTDTLFIRIGGKGKDLLKVFNRYNKILKNLTYQEKNLLKKITKNSYLTKKYNFTDEITLDDEKNLFKIYLPNEQVDYYNDYDNYNNQDMFYTKRINYEKNNIKQDVVSKILKKATETITDFKLSAIDKKIKCFKDNNKLDCIAIFNYMIGKKEKKLKTYYKVAQKEKATYNDYQDFIKSVVCYGTNHVPNNKFWQIVKRELY